MVDFPKASSSSGKMSWLLISLTSYPDEAQLVIGIQEYIAQPWIINLNLNLCVCETAVGAEIQNVISSTWRWMKIKLMIGLNGILNEDLWPILRSAIKALPIWVFNSIKQMSTLAALFSFQKIDLVACKCNSLLDTLPYSKKAFSGSL